jgi:hypothetical protein
MRRREAKIGLRGHKSDRRLKEQKDTGKNPRRNGPFGLDLEICSLVGLDGGGDGDRTCDPLVNEAGSRMIKSETFCESAESSRGRRVPPVWRGGPGGTTLERCLPPLAHAASPVLSVAAAPALRPTPELRNRTTPAGFPSRSICPSRHPIDVLAEVRSALGSAHAFGHSLWQP